MTLPAATYDLVLLLDAEADEQARARVLGETRESIAAQGEVLRDEGWGERALSYRIAHRANASYHLFQFHAATTELLERLERSLRIADEVMRFRVIKLKPGTPEAPAMSPTGGSSEAHPPAVSTPAEGQAASAGQPPEASGPPDSSAPADMQTAADESDGAATEASTQPA